MQSLVVRYVKDLSHLQSCIVNIPFEYKSADQFFIDFYKWCTETTGSETGFLNLGIQPSHGIALEVLTLEEWFWKYKKQ